MADATAPAWSVTSQQEETAINDAGQVVPSVRVTFKTSLGNTGTVLIPRAGYTVDLVRAAVQAQATLVDSISQLTSG